MSIPKTLQNFLDKNKIKCEIIVHKTVYTARDRAATLHIKPEIIGKTMAVVFDGKNYALGLIAANKNLDKKKVLAAFNKIRQKNKEKSYKKIDFAKENWMKRTFKEIDVGATPPFAALYSLPFFIDNSLVNQPKIIVNAGKYELSLKISPKILLKLDAQTLKGSFSMAKR